MEGARDSIEDDEEEELVVGESVGPGRAVAVQGDEDADYEKEKDGREGVKEVELGRERREGGRASLVDVSGIREDGKARGGHGQGDLVFLGGDVGRERGPPDVQVGVHEGQPKREQL